MFGSQLYIKMLPAPFGGPNSEFRRAAGAVVGAGVPFYLGVGAAGSHMLWQIWTVNLDLAADCMAKFGSNKWLGGLMFSGIVADRLL